MSDFQPVVYQLPVEEILVGPACQEWDLTLEMSSTAGRGPWSLTK